MKKPVIIKLGGSAVTKKDEKYTLTSEDTLNRLFKEIKSYSGPLVIISGGGSYGHPAVLERGIDSREGAAYVRFKMQILRKKLAKYFIKNDIPVHMFSPYSIGIEKRGGKIFGPLKRKVERTLKRGEIPFTSGDVVPDVNNSYIVLSGDDQAVYLANVLNAEKIIMVINEEAKGVHFNYPLGSSEPIKRLTGRKWRQVKRKCREQQRAESTPDVTGGILGKVDLLFRTNRKTEVMLIGSSVKGALELTLREGKNVIERGEIPGTYIPKEERVSKPLSIFEEAIFTSEEG